MALRKGLTLNQEAFASALAADVPLKDAYISAGYDARGDSAYRAATRLAKRTEIIERVQSLRSERASIKAEATKLAIERTAITMERVAVELGRIGFANMGDYFRVDQGGNPIIDFGNLTREQTAAITSLQVTDAGNIRFTLGDKRAALMDIAKLFVKTWPEFANALCWMCCFWPTRRPLQMTADLRRARSIPSSSLPHALSRPSTWGSFSPPRPRSATVQPCPNGVA